MPCHICIYWTPYTGCKHYGPAIEPIEIIETTDSPLKSVQKHCPSFRDADIEIIRQQINPDHWLEYGYRYFYLNRGEGTVYIRTQPIT